MKRNIPPKKLTWYAFNGLHPLQEILANSPQEVMEVVKSNLYNHLGEIRFDYANSQDLVYKVRLKIENTRHYWRVSFTRERAYR